jgi:CHAT domain-containing protein
MRYTRYSKIDATNMRRFFVIIFFASVLSHPIKGQALSEFEKDYLLRLSDSIAIHSSIHSNKIDSLYWKMNSYVESMSNKKKKEEAYAMFFAQYALFHPSFSTLIFDTATLNKSIQTKNECLSSFLVHYRSGVWKQQMLQVMLAKGIFFEYMWSNEMGKALSYLKFAENEILNNKQSGLWWVMDIYTMYGDFYNSLGEYDREAHMNNMIVEEYTTRGCPTLLDSVKLLAAYSKLISYHVRKDNFQKVMDLADTYENLFFSIESPIKPREGYIDELEELILLSLNHNFLKHATQTLGDAEDYMRIAGLDANNCPYCINSIKNSKLEILERLHKWKDISEIISKDSIIFHSHKGLYLKSCLYTGDKDEAYRIVENLLQELAGEFLGLQNFHSKIIADRISRITLSRNFRNIRYTLFKYSEDIRFRKYFLEYLLKYKSIGIGVTSNYSQTIEMLQKDSKTKLFDRVKTELKSESVLLEISRISMPESIKYFDSVSDGIIFQFANTTDNYPHVRDIAPFTYAFESGLLISDAIVSVNGKSTRGVISDSIVNMFNEVPIGGMNRVEVKRIGNKNLLQFYTRRDSVFTFRDTTLDKYVFYLIKHESLNEEFGFHMMDAASIDGSMQIEYESKKSGLLQKELLPIFEQGSRGKSIYISADGLFNKINAETLQLLDSIGTPRYLGDLYDIHVLSSARDLLLKDNVTYSNKTISLFGYPDYTLNRSEQKELVKQIGVVTTSLSYLRGNDAVTGSYSFNPLIATKHEVEDIGQTLKQKGWQVNIYTSGNALEEQVKKVQSPSVLHIATHGFFSEDIQPETQRSFMGMDSRDVMQNPLLRSGLAFAGAERTRTDSTSEILQGMDDGILTAEEAQYLHLDSTELVVLSACETGLGEIINGEGVYGLQRAFRAAGAKSILMSLWKVDDDATEALMKNFYKHWLDNGMTKHDALWQAKLDLRNDRNHPEWAQPYYWGAFVLIGE